MNPALLLMLPELLRAGYGIYENIQSAKYAKSPMPAYEIPESLKAALNISKANATQVELPGQSLAEEKLAASTAAGIAASRQATDSPVSMLGQTASLVAGQQGKIRDMATSAAAQYYANQNALKTSLGQMAVEEKNAWTWDKANPWISDMSKAASLQKSGTENIMSALTSAGNMMFAAKYYGMLGGKDASKVLPSEGIVPPMATDVPANFGTGNMLPGGLGLSSSMGGLNPEKPTNPFQKGLDATMSPYLENDLVTQLRLKRTAQDYLKIGGSNIFDTLK